MPPGRRASAVEPTRHLQRGCRAGRGKQTGGKAMSVCGWRANTQQIQCLTVKCRSHKDLRFSPQAAASTQLWIRCSGCSCRSSCSNSAGHSILRVLLPLMYTVQLAQVVAPNSSISNCCRTCLMSSSPFTIVGSSRPAKSPSPKQPSWWSLFPRCCHVKSPPHVNNPPPTSPKMLEAPRDRQPPPPPL